MSWLQTITIIVSIIGVLGGVIFALHNVTRREIDSLRTDINNQLNEIRKDIRMIFDKIIPP